VLPPRSVRIFASAVLLAVAGGTALWLFGGAPQLSRTPGWFYQAVDKGSFDMLLVAAAVATLPLLVRSSFRLSGPRPWTAAMCVVAGSIALQLAAGLVARQQVRGWTDRFFVGHGEFTWRAKDVPDGLALLRNYEALAAQNQLGLYGPSKPPGTYAVYLALDRSARLPLVAAAVSPLRDLVARDARVPEPQRTLFAWTILVLGLCAALTALPLYWLARVLLEPFAEEGSGRVFTFAAWLFASAPAVNVITVHLDGSVFPLLSALSTALCAWSAARAGARPLAAGLAAAAGGLCAVFAVYCSYGNLPIPAMGVVVMIGLLVERRFARSLGRRAWLAPLLGFVAGVLAMCAVLRFALEWQPIAGYLRGVGYHARWRPNLPSAWKHGLAFLEFSVFAGPPLVLTFVASSAHAAWRAVRPHEPAPYGSYSVALATVALIVVISLALGTPEAARLWMFMLPWVACAAALGFRRAALQPAFNVLLASQIALTFFVKNFLVW
jgi:hypothetical protein